MSAILLDNDIVLKISMYDLVDEFLSVCSIPKATFVLPTLKYVFHLHSDDMARKRVGGDGPLKSIRAFLTEVEELHNKPSIKMLNLFQEVDQIDPGEAVLFAMAVTWDRSITITGDKRALVAISSLSNEIDSIKKLSGRLKCLEQIIAEMMIAGLNQKVQEKVHGKKWDTALRICFNSGHNSNTIECLKSYYTDINARCHNMLAPFPTQD